MTYIKKATRCCTLCALPVGDKGFIKTLSDGGRGISDRLRELGFREGCTVSCIGKSPLGGMRAYRVMGSVIALRDEDAATVNICYGSKA